MIDKINGRTPEEIKESMKFCSESSYCSDECPNYSDSTCRGAANALAYIQQLERERDELLQKNQQLERERDAVVEELKVYKFCTACKHDKDDLDANKSSPCFGCHSKSNWEWRGSQEVDN